MAAAPRFWSTPYKYMIWASHEKPAIFYSIILGSFGPTSFFWAPPIRRFFNDDYPIEKIPMTYPSKSC